MGATSSQITSLTIVYSSVFFRRRSKKTSTLRVTGLCVRNSPVTGEFPAQMAGNAENVSIWWRHHDYLWSEPLFSAIYARGSILTRAWWRHQMETFSALLAICAGNSPVPGVFPTQRPVTRSFDVFIDLRLNKRLSKQSRSWWFETLSCLLRRHRNGPWCSVGLHAEIMGD